MHKLAICFLFFFVLSQTSKAQRDQLILGVSGSIEWNLYQNYKRPKNHEISILSGDKRSAGQVLNVLPSARLGAFFIIDQSQRPLLGLLVEGGISYMPFSFDTAERKGQGALSIPINALMVVGLDIVYTHIILTIGGGIQFSKMEFDRRTDKYQGIDNPFFRTYTFEVGIGGGNLYFSPLRFGLLFARFGFGAEGARSFDLGFRYLLGPNVRVDLGKDPSY